MRYEIRYERNHIPDVWFFNAWNELEELLGILERARVRKLFVRRLADNEILHDTRSVGDILHDNYTRRKSKRRNKRRPESI